jgi:hypothetical protein
MKRKQALFAAALITVLLALGLVAVGVNAAINPNSVPASDSPAGATIATTGDAQAQIDQLKGLIAQYQAREKQYQQQLTQASTEVQQLQSILGQLQQAGIITIQRDGSITVGRGRERGFGSSNNGSGSSLGGSDSSQGIFY